jgi:hypothetical protein
LALMGIMCSGLRVEATPLAVPKVPPLAQSTMSFGFAGGVEPQPMLGRSKG